MTKDFPCQCSHPRNLHYHVEWTGCAAVISTFISYQVGNNKPYDNAHRCLCKEYTADNLRYLEEMSK